MATELGKGLNMRHLTMISIGGTIGTGLFVGISSPLDVAGSAGAPIAYTIAGIIMLLTMLSLGELSSAMPHSGSFQHYMSVLFKKKYWSFMVGWLYWLSWVLTISADLTATSMTLNSLFPAISTTLFIVLILIFICSVHLYTVGTYGDSETLFASLKIVTIVAFLIACAYLIFGDVETISRSRIMDEPSRLPNGIIGIFASMSTVTFAFQGVEIIGTLAGEAEDRGASMNKVIKMLIIRVFLFYILTTMMLVFVYPPGAKAAISPFVWVFAQAGIPNADVVMKLVIVLCGLSASSSALYASSRLLWSMSKDKIAPRIFAQTSQAGSPFWSVLFTAAIASVALVSAYIAPKQLYFWLIASTGQVGCLAWFCIALCHYCFRRAKEQGLFAQYPLHYRAPFFPWLPLLAMALNIISIVGLWFSEDGLAIFIAELTLVGLLTLGYCVMKRRARS